MYDTDKTKVSMGVMIEINEALRQYRDSFILAGGWAPYFLTRRYFDHCGSMDIDMIVRPRILRKYETIRNSVTSIGFKATPNPFRFERKIGELTIELDFLSEPEALDKIPKEYVRVQEDLAAVIVPGCTIAFKFNFETNASGKLTDGSELSTRIRVADIVSMAGMKGHALGRPLKLEKDCYDLYAICGFTRGTPAESAREYDRRIRGTRLVRKEKSFLEQALARIVDYFPSENGRGPIAVSRFFGIDEGRKVDSYQRVSTFLGSVHSH